MALGNDVVNSIFEKNCKGRTKPTASSTREEKEKWIRSKYEKKEFIAPLNSSQRIEQQLAEAIYRSDVASVAHILAHASSPEQINGVFYQSGGRSPLHLAAGKGSLAIVQLLIWVRLDSFLNGSRFIYTFLFQYNAKVTSIDADGKTPLYYARVNRHKDIEELLQQQGCTETSLYSESTFPPRRESLTSKASDVFDKLPASII